MGTNETRPESNNPRAGLGLQRAMRMQALRAPWSEVAAAVARLIEWRSFGLWVRAIADSERAIPIWLAAALQERCPSFLESRREGGDMESLWIDLSEWIDNHFFGDAQRGGLDSGPALLQRAHRGVRKGLAALDSFGRRMAPTAAKCVPGLRAMASGCSWRNQVNG